MAAALQRHPCTCAIVILCIALCLGLAAHQHMLFPSRCAAALSAKIRQGLLNINMIDSFGKVLEEPR